MKKLLITAVALATISTSAYAQVGASNSESSAGVAPPAIPPVGEGLDINANAKAGVSAETPGIDNREARQNQRIENGVESGQLNEHEANRLERQQDRIENAETKAKADGEVTKKERARIQHKQNKANHNIARKKHNKH